MLKKSLWVLLLAVFTVVGVAAVSADDTSNPLPPAFTDGRLNAYDPAAPIVIYEPQVSIPALQENGFPGSANVIGSIQILKWDSTSENSWLALEISVDDINKAIAKHPGKDFVITTKNGVSLGYSQSGYFWVTTTDSEGKTYTFVWEKDF